MLYISEFSAESKMASISPDSLESTTEILNPSQTIEEMIDLRIQLHELEQRIQALQPSFSIACITLKIDKIALDRAIITRRLTPGQWAYSPKILEQAELLKQSHEPTKGKEVTWAIRLLLTIA
jgi:hypothetical protein